MSSAFTVTFSNQEALDIDAKYDNGDLNSGAFKKTPEISDNDDTMTVDAQDSHYRSFKSKYIKGVQPIIGVMKDDSSFSAWVKLYSYLSRTNPAAAQKTEPKKENTNVQASLSLPTLQPAPSPPAQTPAATYSLGKDFSDGLQQREFPYRWLEAYIGKSSLSQILAPILDLLFYPDQEGPKMTSVDLLKENHSEITHNAGVLEGATTYLSNLLRGGNEGVELALRILDEQVIPHFETEIFYTEFTFEQKQGETVLETYSVTAVYDPETYLEIQISLDDQNSVIIYKDFETNENDLIKLSQKIGDQITDDCIRQAARIFRDHLPPAIKGFEQFVTNID